MAALTVGFLLIFFRGRSNSSLYQPSAFLRNSEAVRSWVSALVSLSAVTFKLQVRPKSHSRSKKGVGRGRYRKRVIRLDGEEESGEVAVAGREVGEKCGGMEETAREGASTLHRAGKERKKSKRKTPRKGVGRAAASDAVLLGVPSKCSTATGQEECMSKESSSVAREENCHVDVERGEQGVAPPEVVPPTAPDVRDALTGEGTHDVPVSSNSKREATPPSPPPVESVRSRAASLLRPSGLLRLPLTPSMVTQKEAACQTEDSVFSSELGDPSSSSKR
mgnify:FL=1